MKDPLDGTIRDTLAEGTEGAQQLGPERARVYYDLSPEDKDRMQLNSKFVNNMLPEWGRFVTAVKLNRGLRDSNYDQLSQGNNVRGAVIAGYGGAQNRVGNANPGQARQIKQNVADAFSRIKGYTDEESADSCMMIRQLLCMMMCDEQPNEAPTAQTMFMANLSSTDPVYDEARVLSYEIRHYSYQSNIIPYDQYVKDNEVPVVQSNVSSVPNDAYMMILNDIYEPSAQCVFVTTQNNVVENLLTAELTTYKEQVKLYERRAKFELTEREPKIDEQLRIVITYRNRKEESLKRELHSVKLQLTSTINHNKSMVEEVTSLKKDFKQKENKYLEEFLDMKALKEKPVLYNGHEIIKTNHVPAIVHKSEDTLEIAEITRKKMNDKMKDPECVKKKVKIAPHDYSKENYLATFTPQKKLTLEQIFWSNDLIKMKAEALKEQTTAS
ncbi:hypothetical protein Tco_1411119 [Tanacetum coccineum]